MKTMDAPETARLLDETLKTLATLAGLDPKVLRQSYAPGKWTAAEIFAHLAFVDAVFLYRFLKAVAEDGSVIVPFDENLWQKELEAATQPVAVSLATIVAAHTMLHHLVGTLPAARLARVAQHPERGPMSALRLAGITAGHALHHARQIEAIRDGRTWSKADAVSYYE